MFFLWPNQNLLQICEKCLKSIFLDMCYVWINSNFVNILEINIYFLQFSGQIMPTTVFRSIIPGKCIKLKIICGLCLLGSNGNPKNFSLPRIAHIQILFWYILTQEGMSAEAESYFLSANIIVSKFCEIKLSPQFK